MRNLLSYPYTPIGIALAVLILAGLACSSIDDVIGQRPAGVTPTVQAFATATPGGRVSVSLITPVGQSATNTPLATGIGQLIAPAATATAAYATFQAATATAAAPVIIPALQAGECPSKGVPLSPPQPSAFSQYPEAIGRYLSAGGPTTVLESMLRSWKAFAEGAVIQTDTDLTGDGVPEIIITLYDPALYQPGQPAPGQLLIFGCAQKAYRLLYNTPYGPNAMIPVLKRVGGMNDIRPKLAFLQQTCNNSQCTETMQILGWNETLGVFKPLNDVPINTTNARVGIADIDNDGILEVLVVFNPTGDPAAGPPRKTTDIWDWDGTVYTLAVSEVDPAVYRIHAAHDGDYLFGQGDWKNAIRQYDRVRDDKALLPWIVPNEPIMLPAYATYKKMLAWVGYRQFRTANQTLTTLQTENPTGSPGEGYALMATAFMDNYNKTKNSKKACDAALAVAAVRPETLGALNSYGYANRTYTLTDLCPFTDK